MDCNHPGPSQVNHRFWETYRQLGTIVISCPSKRNDTSRSKAIVQNIAFEAETPLTVLFEITINSSKPEKILKTEVQTCQSFSVIIQPANYALKMKAIKVA